MTPFDVRLYQRTLAFALAALGVALGIVVVTDEPYSTLGMRLARLGAFSPALAAAGVLSALAQARVRRETMALSALGVRPLRLAAGSVAAGWSAGVLGCVVLSTPWADTAALFPMLTPTAEWIPDAHGFSAPEFGVRVTEDGAIELTESVRPPHRREPGAIEALAVLAPLALTVPVWAATAMSYVARLGTAMCATGLSVITLHGVAASRVSLALGLAGPAVLALGSIVGARNAKRLRAAR